MSNSRTHSTNYDVAGATHTGRIRQINEDSFLTVHIPGTCDTLLAVADGVGGRDVGDIASRMVIRRLLDARMSSLHACVRMHDCAERMQLGIREANLFLFKLNRQFGNSKFATGTTLTTLHLFGEQGIVFNVGDSRCYRMRKGKLNALTHDDTVAQQLVDEKKMCRHEALHHPLANTLYRCVGTEPTIKTGFKKVGCRRYDRYIVATDGVWKVLSQDQIKLAVGDSTSAREAVDRLILAALRDGSRDNLSVCAAFMI